jgi:hypothetical protein
MTYLELVNAVLRKLREDEVGVVNESDYSKLIGDFVNDALNVVESSWDWSSLRESLVISTTPNVDTYPLAGFGIRGEVMSIYNITNKTELRYHSKAYIVDQQTRAVGAGKPRYYTLNGTDSNNDTNLIVYPNPDDTYTLEANVVLRNQSMSADADSTKLPTQPIIQYAFAYALRERGETGGQGAMEQLVMAQTDLANAIALDAGNNAGELIFDVL